MKNLKIQPVDLFAHIFDDDFGRNMKKVLDRKYTDVLESKNTRELPIRGKPKDVEVFK